MLGGPRVPDIGGATVPCIVVVADLGEAVNMHDYGSLEGLHFPPGADRGGCPAYMAPEISRAT